MTEMSYEIKKELGKLESAFDEKVWHEEDVRRGMDAKDVDWSTKDRYIVAKDGDEVVGTLHVAFKAGVGHIHSVIVDSHQRGKGVGIELMKRCEHLAGDMKAHKLELVTRPDYKEAYPLYLKLGFSNDYVMKQHYLGKGYHLMSKLLD